MAVDNKIKRAVAKSWIEFFPELHLVTPQKMYKILGNSIVGIEIDSNGDWYGAYFVMYPLYGHALGTDLSIVLSGPMFFENKFRGSLIPYTPREEKHKIIPKEEIKSSYGICLTGDITLANFLDYIDHTLLTEDRAFTYSTGTILYLFLLKLVSSLYVGNTGLAQQILDDMTTEKVKWKSHDLSSRYSKSKNPFFKGDTFEEFYSNIQSVIDHPAPMLEIIERNKNDPKLRKLKRSEILPG